MYDAKKENKDNDKSLRSDCVGDKNYFGKEKNDTLLSYKNSYVPIENIFQ